MLDALIPAMEAAKSGLEDNLPSIEVLKKAYEASAQGVEFTKTIAARKGRASYLGDRSIGFQDPGATSSTLLLKCTYESVKAFREA
jgi:dihydroxyacetone kinase-like protein